PSPIPESIEQTLNDAWENFSKLIVVRRSDKPMAALMTPERIELIRKNLALKLEAARLALINQHQTLFTESIAI
ncbi:MAG: uroporphyrinogen-III C-methyltransferase, partial [Cycloclasticus sp.]